MDIHGYPHRNDLDMDMDMDMDMDAIFHIHGKPDFYGENSNLRVDFTKFSLIKFRTVFSLYHYLNVFTLRYMYCMYSLRISIYHCIHYHYIHIITISNNSFSLLKYKGKIDVGASQMPMIQIYLILNPLQGNMKW